MRRCNVCNVKVVENTKICPLCRNSLEELDGNTKEEMYPEIKLNQKVINLILRILLFVAVISGAILLYINYVTYNGNLWSVICCGAIAYLWITVRYSIQQSGNIANKILVQVIAALGLTFLIDMTIGYTAWSVNFAFPCIIIAGNIGIIALMAVNFNNWQGYIPFQIIFMVLSILMVALKFIGIVANPLMTYIAATSSVLFFGISMIFGDRKAKIELRRRFHI